MKCEVLSCGHEATKLLLVEGIHHGVYLSFSLHHCGGHSPKELKQAEQRQRDRELRNFTICDPMQSVKLVRTI